MSVQCPKCQSTQLTANKKGFSGGKAVAGALLTGGVGLLAGTIGKDDVIITCMSCGHQWEPKNYQQETLKQQGANEITHELQFIKLYKSDKAAAESYFNTHLSTVYPSADVAYNKINSRKNTNLYILAFFVIAFIILFVFFL